ncbi:hypothetical protein CBR_g905 [Chara braunii]|uniref:Photolyase/cryptochrome alpha/beta domain-containing protein n=1 Tax=Chara braunii TaxID=69332 RepID=A0A388KCJ9_CHABU|nr:hypothetical protein CBR_g905 [Chara braunii]|eukprot:GBG67780.1 hypothetical protein CBR_g905 [Chara braunii]
MANQGNDVTPTSVEDLNRVRESVERCYDEGVCPDDAYLGEVVEDREGKRFEVNKMVDEVKEQWLRERSVVVTFQGEARNLQRSVKEDLIRAYEDGWTAKKLFQPGLRRGRVKFEGANVASYVAKAKEIADWLVQQKEMSIKLANKVYSVSFKPRLSRQELQDARIQEAESKFWIMALRVPLDAYYFLRSAVPGVSEWVSDHMAKWEAAKPHFGSTAEWLDGGIAITSGILDAVSRILARERNIKEADFKRRVKEAEERMEGHPISVMVWAAEREKRLEEWDNFQVEKQRWWTELLQDKGIETHDKMTKETFQKLLPSRSQHQMVELKHPFNESAPTACSSTGMLQYARLYYEDVLSTRRPQDDVDSDLSTSSDMWDNTGVRLSTTARLDLDRPLTLEEVTQMLKTMARGKSPGVDGLTVEFYITNWGAFGESLVKLYNKVTTGGKLGKGMTHGVISVLFKKGDKARGRVIARRRQAEVITADRRRGCAEISSSQAVTMAAGALATRHVTSRASVVAASAKGAALDTNRRRGEGTSIVWFRNDLRVHDNEALLRAWQDSDAILPVFCFDPRLFKKTFSFGLPKTGEIRAQFLLESVEDLQRTLESQGSVLVVRHGKPEDIIPGIVRASGAHTVYGQKETCSEELYVERKMSEALKSLQTATSGKRNERGVKLQLFWGSTLYHLDDLPFRSSHVPDVYTQFRKSVESSCRVRLSLKMPTSLGPKIAADVIDAIGGKGMLPSFQELGYSQKRQLDPRAVLQFRGGETVALARLEDYFWKKDKLRVYKETRNGMLGADYSTKFSPWLAFGCLSPRFIHDELIWRDYFRFLTIKYGNNIFKLGGPRNVAGKQLWNRSTSLFDAWKEGRTGYPLVDANMRELSSTGFMSNRGRQIVCSFFVRDMGMDWRMGAEWFETCLLDYDPASNYGNWTYGAGVGNDPREDRYFSIPKQSATYDPDGEYVAHWIPELAQVPMPKRHAPYRLSTEEQLQYGVRIGEGGDYPEPIVPLKFGDGGGSRPVNGPRPRSAPGRGNFRARPAGRSMSSYLQRGND